MPFSLEYVSPHSTVSWILMSCGHSIYLHYFSLIHLSFFSWNIIALRCFSLCCTTEWVGYKYTYIPSVLDLPPAPPPNPLISVITEHWAGLPVLCSRFPLAFHVWWCIYVKLNLLRSHPPLPHLCPHGCALHLHLCSCPAVGSMYHF